MNQHVLAFAAVHRKYGCSAIEIGTLCDKFVRQLLHPAAQAMPLFRIHQFITILNHETHSHCAIVSSQSMPKGLVDQAVLGIPLAGPAMNVCDFGGLFSVTEELLQ